MNNKEIENKRIICKNQNKRCNSKDGLDLTYVLLTLELVRSFKAHWKSKELVLKFDNRKDMTQFTNLMEMFYAIEEDILEEEENKKNKCREVKK